MYVPDTLNRMNQDQVDRHYEEIADQVAKIANNESWAKAHEDEIIVCDYCDKPATISIPVYNPADSVRDVEGAYAVYNLCEECEEQGYWMEDTFYCEGCGELFVTNHSWDVLYTKVDGSLYCQACALDVIEPITLEECLQDLKEGRTDEWHRINAAPGHEELWYGEYSGYSDFPGHTSFNSIVKEIVEAAEDKGYDLDTLIIPLITQGYQFSVVLGIFIA